ncbi:MULTISPECIES: nuclear transport factor 2 family protein [unclassified Caballeronia]|uniref:nuclear transport factor 2 family protein n=1 Tax=unclassified Caballeronia TaxID=2646786 RepID=UPI002857222D|nr:MULTISPECIES: nuclear transport factor 2 family protein [unclassified Caballeronia]MDR5753952.1 nuclear transport factor 2 family protein [Caballeronia sp. LZ024]MDR5840331.1 nuclear transport factor 2 family protein [Caballeronia sp. LZ031]
MNAQSPSRDVLIDRYFDAWNETDAERRATLIRASYAEHASYRDPLLHGDGHAGIDAMIRAVHERFPAHTFRRTTDVDGFANHLRFSWELRTPQGQTIVKGTDFGTLDDNERIVSITGFLDQTPGAAL